MSYVEQRISELGLELPASSKLPDGVHIPFSLVNIRGTRVFVSGHPMSNPDGTIGGPYGQLGRDLTLEEGYAAAQQIALSVLANLKHELGDLSRITGWSRVFGMVNTAPEFDAHHLVVNGFSDTILQIFGADCGRHARSAIGVSGLPMNFAMEIEAELEIGIDND